MEHAWTRHGAVRVIANVVSGIGFLGTSAKVKDRLNARVSRSFRLALPGCLMRWTLSSSF
jgi:hypothetical protein